MFYLGVQSQMALSLIKNDVENMAGLVTIVFFFLSIPLGVFIFFLLASHYYHSKLQQDYQFLAHKLELQYVPPPKKYEFRFGGFSHGFPSITGQIHQFHCRIWLKVIRGGKRASRVQSFFEVYHPHPLQLGLEIKPQIALLNMFSGLVGNHDIQINDSVFDQQFHIQGMNPNQVFQFLTPERKMAIYSAQQALHQRTTLRITDTMVQAHLRTVSRSPEEIIHIMKHLVLVAQALSPQR